MGPTFTRVTSITGQLSVDRVAILPGFLVRCRAGLTQPLWSPSFIPETKQKVDFWRANAGLRGDLGLGDWRYDGNIQFSRTKGRDDRQATLTENITNVLIAVVAPAGTPEQFITHAIPGQYRAGEAFTCESNVTNGAYNGGTCQPVNIFDPQVLLNGHITAPADRLSLSLEQLHQDDVQAVDLRDWLRRLALLASRW